MSEFFSDEQKIKEVRRELRQRENVYPRLVASGKLPQATADRQIAIMRAIADDYFATTDLLAKGDTP